MSQLPWNMHLAINCKTVKVKKLSKFSTGLNIDTTLRKVTNMLYTHIEDVEIVTCRKPNKNDRILTIMSVVLKYKDDNPIAS